MKNLKLKHHFKLIVGTRGPVAFSQEVEQYLDDGWKFHGRVKGSQKSGFYQAMIKRTTVEFEETAKNIDVDETAEDAGTAKDAETAEDESAPDVTE